MADGIITTRVVVPASSVDLDKVDRFWSYRIYDDSSCDRCPYRPDRPSFNCEGCEHNLGVRRTYREVTKDGVDYVALPPGDLSRIDSLLGLDTKSFDDRRPIHKLKYDLKFTGTLWTGGVVDGRRVVDQEGCVTEWLRSKSGIIQAPPRSGKTAMACSISCRLNVKTLIVANKMELLKQFYRTYLKMTNVRELREETGERIVGIVRQVSDVDRFDIALLNYQKFIRDETAMARIKDHLRGEFTLLVVDEVHQASATSYAKFVSRLDSRYRLGLSATPRRKDHKDVYGRDFIGPVVTRVDVTGMKPRIELLETGVYTKYEYRSWVGAMKFLAESRDRQEMIVREVFRDLRDGHHGIIIPVDFKSQASELVSMINRQARVNEDVRNETWPEETAVMFHAGCDRDAVLRGIDSGRYEVIVAIRGMIKQGVDLVRPTMLYVVVPMSAQMGVGAPMFEQLSFRVATYHEGKRQPVCKIFLDGVGFSHGCLKGLWWKEIYPKLTSRRNIGDESRYICEGDDMRRLIEVSKMRKYVPPNEPGVRIKSAGQHPESGDRLPIMDDPPGGVKRRRRF